MLLKRCYIYLFLVLVIGAAETPLSQKANVSLLQALGGTSLEQRQARLERLGALFFGNRTSEGQQKGNASTITRTLPVDLITDPANDASIAGINQREGVSEYLFQGDINLTEKQLDKIEASLVSSGTSRAKRQADRVSNTWTNNIVYYHLDASLNTRKRNMVQAALNYIKARTCVDFVQDSAAANRIRVVSDAGCYSFVGMTGGEQLLSLGDGCELIGIVAHEFMHALGVWHMQMRDDRDDYVAINLAPVPVRIFHLFRALQASRSMN
ncbi:astacin [Ancylostoma caninum]|uniref:Metalloendopeptidase n=1 Tax=Ancylostoma caninum TaxID=29170 RepID=A0A368GIB8_ANCCA|nr:astacin [Ancylostoma caninum]